MKILQIITAICVLGMASCGGGGAESVAPVAALVTSKTAPPRTLPADSEIMAKVYDTSYQVPDDFFVDDRASTPVSYTVHHVKDVSMSYELCTNDYNEALEWEAADNDSRAVSGFFVGSTENDKYFEFVRELSFTGGIGNISDPTSPSFSRVFKCSYVNRDGVDRNLRNGYAGTLNVRPLSSNAIATFAEYLWQFTFFWPASAKVLESFSSEQEDTYEHTLLLALATIQGTDQCDLIEVVDWVFSVDKNSRQITKKFNILFDFEARFADGVPELCNG